MMFLEFVRITEKRYEDGSFFAEYLCTRCGNLTLKIPHKVFPKGNTVSCGCYKKSGGSKHRVGKSPGNALKDPQEASFNGLYSAYRTSARNKKLPFEFSKEQFKQITGSLCHYCGTAPFREHKHKWSRKHYVFNGIDRKDNNIGYTLNNCVPCCAPCNYLKRASSYEDFIKHILKIGRWVGKL